MYYTKKCEWCGKEFSARKSNTRYCSKQCADHANKQRLRDWTKGIVQGHHDDEIKASFGCVLSLKELSEFLCVSKTTAFRYVSEGLIPSLVVRGRIKVLKANVEKVFNDAPPYKKQERYCPEKKAGLSSSPGIIQEEKGYTTVKESAEKYDLSPAYVDKLFNKSGITVVFHRGKKYYPVSEVNSLFRKREADSHPEIKEWYTCKEIEEKYCLTQGTVRDIVSTRQIPKKNVHGIAYYSKVHFDIARGQASEQTLYYTVKEAMAKFHQTRDQVYNVLRYNNIQRILEGRIVKFRKADYDDCMKFTFKD